MRPTFNNFYIEWITILMVLCSTAAPIEIPPPQEIALQETMDHLHLNRSFLPKNLPKSNKVLSGIPIPTGIPLPTFSPITLTETSTRSFLDELNLVNINNNKQLSVQNQGSTANFNPPSQSGQSSGTGYGSYGSGNVLGQPSVPVFNQQPTSGNFGNGPSTFNNGQNFQGQSSTGFGMSTGNNQQQQSGYGANTGNIQQQQPQQQQQQQQQQQLQQPIQSSGYSGGANFGGPSIPMGQFGQSFSPSPASNPQLGSMMNQGSSFGGPSDQGQRQNSFGPVTAQNNIQPGSGGSYSVGLPAVSSGQFGPVGAGPQMVPNSASQSYSGGVPAQIPVQQFSPPSSSSSGSYGGGSPMQSGIQNSQPTGFQNSGQQASSAGFTVSPIAQSLAPLTGFTAAPVTPSAAFNQIQGSNQLASGFASSLPAALNPVGQNIGSSSGLNNGFSQTGNNPQSQNFNNQLGNNQQQTQSFYGGASGNAQLPVIQQQQQQSSFPFGQLPQQFINPVQQPIEPSGYGIGTPSVSPSFGQSGYGNSVSQPVPQPQPQPQFYGSSPQNSFNSPPGQGSAIQSYGSSFPQGEVYGGPGTAQLNPMVGHQQPSYGGMSSSPQSGYGQSGNNINRPNSSGAGNVPFGGSGGNQAGGYGLGNQGANQNFGGSSGGNGGAFGTGSNNAGQGGQNSVFAASIPNGQGLQGTTQSLFNNPNQPQGQSGFNQQNQQLGSNLQNQNLITTTPFSGFGGLASLAASIQQQLGGPTNPASSGSSNSIGATPSSAISPNQVQQQQTGQQNPQPGQVNNQQVNNQQLTNQLNSNPNQLNGGLSGNQLNQQGFPSTNSNQNQLNGGLSGNQGYQQGLLPVNGNPGNQQGSGLGGNQQNQQNINQLNQAPQNIGGNTGSQLYG